MSYRILLPAFEPLAAATLAEMLADFQAECLGVERPQWRIGALMWKPDRPLDFPLLVTLYSADQVCAKPYDSYFHAPRNVKCWVELRVTGEDVSQTERLQTRLMAVALALRLDLPVLETRRGVYCRTPAAFVAWCSGEEHRHQIPLSRKADTSEPAPERCSLVGKSVHPATSPVGSAEAVGLPRASTYVEPPEERWITRLWNTLTGRQHYVIPLPIDSEEAVAQKLLAEVRATFPQTRVVYEHQYHRLVIHAKDTAETRDKVHELQRQTGPPRAPHSCQPSAA